MRLHLLQHDPTDLSSTNITIWAEKRGYEVSRTYVYNMEEMPPMDELDWLILMGGSPHAWEEEVNPWLPGEKAFIADAIEQGKTVLGICFGAQLLAEALGGRVFPNKYKEIGWHSVSLTPEGRDSFLFRDIPETFITFHWHSDHFSLPSGCTRLAFSEPTENQAFICRGHSVAGIQFHPEFTLKQVRYFSREYGDEWVKGPFVSGKEGVQTKTEEIQETYWLMEKLLDNMDLKFGGMSGD